MKTAINSVTLKRVTLKRVRLTAGLAVGLAAALLGSGLGISPAQAGIPAITRAEIIARAESGIGAMYTWGRESWTPNQGGGTGPDCSGFTLKCWEVPRTLLYQEEDGENATICRGTPVTSSSTVWGRGPASADRSQLREGDVLVKNNGISGHVVIYAGGDAWNSPIIYEAPGTGLERPPDEPLSGQRVPAPAASGRRRSAASSSTTPRRRASAETDLGGNWTRSTSRVLRRRLPGAEPATTATAGPAGHRGCRSSGYYNVYLRWTSDPNRASAVQVNVNTPSGQYKRYVSQRINGGIWYSLGRYYFNAGYTPAGEHQHLGRPGANGYVVADAVKFVKVP